MHFFTVVGNDNSNTTSVNKL